MDFEKSLSKLKESMEFSKEITLGDLKLTLRVLSLKEELKLNKMLDAIEEESSPELNDWKKIVISMSICAIDGVKLPSVIEVGEEKTEKGLYLREFLEEVPSQVIDTLFAVYIDLKEESETSLEKSVTYNWFKDPEVREEETKKRLEEAQAAQEAEIKRLQSLQDEEEIAISPSEEETSDEEYSDSDVVLTKVD